MKDIFTNLSNREKTLIKVLIVFLAIVIIYFIIITPIIRFRKNMDSEYSSNQKKINTLDRLYEKYKEVKYNKKYYIKKLKNNKAVSTLIEENAEKTKIVGNKIYNRDRQVRKKGQYKKILTEVRFEGVDIKSALMFLYLMENSNKLLNISYLRIHQALKGKETYDVQIKFESYQDK